jgi:septum formation protein
MLLILGSQSPRRKEILSYFSLPFVQIASNFDEESLPFEGDPVQYTTELALRKAADLAIRFPAETIVTADTVVFFEGQVFNKPKNEEEGASMLRAFSGKWQEVYTGVAVRKEDQLHAGWEMTRILFNPLTKRQIDLYLQSCSYLDKAGGYAIQHQGGLLVAKIDGCYDNVMGLPTNTLGRLLGKVGIDLWAHLKSERQG